MSLESSKHVRNANKTLENLEIYLFLMFCQIMLLLKQGGKYNHEIKIENTKVNEEFNIRKSSRERNGDHNNLGQQENVFAK